MSRYWFYLLVALTYYAALGWCWFVLSRLPRRPTAAFRWRLAGWLLLLASPSLWLTFRLDDLFPSTTLPAAFAFLILLIAAATFTVATALGYAGFLGARMYAQLRGFLRKTPVAAASAPQAAAPQAVGAKDAPSVDDARATGSGTAPEAAPAAPTGSAAQALAPTQVGARAPFVPPLNADREQLDLTRRRWLQSASYGYLGLLCLTAGGAAWTRSIGLTVQRRQIHCPRLPQAFQGYRIVQVADIHSGTYMSPAQMEIVRQAVADLKPDLIVFTGDQVDRRPYEMAPFLSSFNGLSAPDGVFGILGNHDYIAGGRFVRESLNANGIPMLVNQSVRIRRGEQSLVLGGLDDLWHGNPDLEATFRQAGPADFKLCLAHNPNCWDFLAPAGVDLTLAGHTHGGQINMMSDSLSPARLLSKYVRGEFQQGDTRLFVSVGVGYVGIPVRIGVPSEIVEITLV